MGEKIYSLINIILFSSHHPLIDIVLQEPDGCGLQQLCVPQLELPVVQTCERMERGREKMFLFYDFGIKSLQFLRQGQGSNKGWHSKILLLHNREKDLSVVVKVLREIFLFFFFARKSRKKVVSSWKVIISGEPNLETTSCLEYNSEASSASQEFSIKNPIECENGKEKEPQTCSFATSFRG